MDAGFFAQPQTPAAIVNRLNGEFVKALNNPQLRSRLVEKNFEPVGSTAQAFGELVASDLAKYAVMIPELNIQAD